MLSAGMQDPARLSSLTEQQLSTCQRFCSAVSYHMVLGTRFYPSLLVLWISEIPSKHNIYITQVLIGSGMSHSTLLCAASEVDLMHCILPLIHTGRELGGWWLKNLFAQWPFVLHFKFQ